MEIRDRAGGSNAFIKEFAKRVWREVDEDNVTGLAAQMSYYFVLALFPFFIFLAALVGTLPFTGLWDSILRGIVLYLPAPSQHLVFDTVTSLTRGHRSFLSLGLLGTASASCTGIMNLMGSLNLAYEVKETRSFFKRLAFSFLMLFVFAILTVASFALLAAGDWIDKWLVGHSYSTAPWLFVWQVGRWLASLFFIAVAVSVANNALPNLRRPWRLLSAGTIFVVAAWIPATLGFNLYLRYVASYDKTYGALGTFVVLLVWIYLGSLITLIGAEINCELYKMRTGSGRSTAQAWSGPSHTSPLAVPYRLSRPGRSHP